MLYIQTHDMTQSRAEPAASDNFLPRADIAYFKQRLDQTMTQANYAGEICARAAHSSLAELYRLKLSELRASLPATAILTPLSRFT